jgi:hypothetical protein
LSKSLRYIQEQEKKELLREEECRSSISIKTQSEQHRNINLKEEEEKGNRKCWDDDVLEQRYRPFSIPQPWL